MKLRNKLILSCAALAAVATTAVSTTFAWYTSNTTVTADKISGSTQALDEATLLISKTGAVGTWGSKVSLDINATQLVPVAYQATDTYYTFAVADSTAFDAAKSDLYLLDGTEYKPVGEATYSSTATYYKLSPKGYHAWDKNENAPEKTAAATSAYIQFSLYFKSGSTKNLDVNLTQFNLVETTTALTSKMALSSDGLVLSSANSTYTCNFFRALTYVEEIGASTEVAAGSTAAWNDGVTPTRTAYNIEAYGTKADNLADSCNAHKYYNSVKGLYEITSDTAIDSGKTYYTFNTATGVYTAVASPDVDAIDTYYECTGIDMNKANSETLVTYANRTSTNLGQTGAGSLTDLSPILKVTYTIYLDGWDKYCFDACQGQSFSLDFEFTGTNHA